MSWNIVSTPPALCTHFTCSESIFITQHPHYTGPIEKERQQGMQPHVRSEPDWWCGCFSSQVCLFYFVCLLSDGFCNYKSLKDDVDVLGRDGFSALLQEFSIFTYGVPRRFRYLSSSDHGDFYLWHNHIWKDPGEKGDEVNFVGGQASYLKHAQWFSEVCHCRSDIICLQKKP